MQTSSSGHSLCLPSLSTSLLCVFLFQSGPTPAGLPFLGTGPLKVPYRQMVLFLVLLFSCWPPLDTSIYPPLASLIVHDMEIMIFTSWGIRRDN
jgi:hypothetical protein